MAGVLPAFKGQVSDRFIRENLMKGVGQSEAMQEEIWGEQAGQFFFERMLQMFATLQEQGDEGMQALQESGGDLQGAMGRSRAVRTAGEGRGEDFITTNQRPTPNAEAYTPYGREAGQE